MDERYCKTGYSSIPCRPHATMRLQPNTYQERGEGLGLMTHRQRVERQCAHSNPTGKDALLNRLPPGDDFLMQGRLHISYQFFHVSFTVLLYD